MQHTAQAAGRQDEMDKARRLVLPLEEVRGADVALVGGKGASLGEMLAAGAPVPPAFVVTTAAYDRFMRSAALFDLIDRTMRGVSIEDSVALGLAAKRLQNAIRNAPMPVDIVAAIEEAYRGLGLGPVAVRSSATAEDLPDASFAGQQRTFLNVIGGENVVRAVQGCWASLFEARAIFYRETHDFNHLDVAMAVPVQRMVPADASGVMFTADPGSNDRSLILIEAIFGLGEPLVSGELSPDAYLVDKDGLAIKQRDLAMQPWLLRESATTDGFEHGSAKVPVPRQAQIQQKLADEHILELARMGLRLEEHYGHPQDIEWALSRGQLYVLQSRNITTLDTPLLDGLTSAEASPGLGEAVAILVGSAASPGVGSGAVRIVKGPQELASVQPGDVLVTEMTTPDFVPAMKRASAIVTDRGGRTCHAAIVSREMGIPCVVGTGSATEALREIKSVTVDGTAGKVYAGILAAPSKNGTAVPTHAPVETRTKLYVNLADPDAAERVAAMDVDGVGLLRAEFIMAHIGEHPRAMLESGRGAEFTRMLAGGLETFAKAFNPRPVVFRFSDFKTNEYRNLRGGQAYEPQEENPMIGYRGCARYLAEPDLFALEIDAVKQVRRSYPNLWVMVPFIRTVEEMQAVKALMEARGLRREKDFKLWMMLEVPSNVVLLEDFLAAGVDGVSIGSNDLTQLTLGVDRDNERLAELFDERNPAVHRCLEKVVKGCVAAGKTVSICGQAPSVYPELTRDLVSWGINSISVSPDMINETRGVIHDAENLSRSALAL